LTLAVIRSTPVPAWVIAWRMSRKMAARVSALMLLLRLAKMAEPKAATATVWMRVGL